MREWEVTIERGEDRLTRTCVYMTVSDETVKIWDRSDKVEYIPRMPDDIITLKCPGFNNMKPEQPTVRVSVEDDKRFYSSISFSDDEEVMLNIYVTEELKQV